MFSSHRHQEQSFDPGLRDDEIQSDKTDHIAMHKGAVLHKID